MADQWFEDLKIKILKKRGFCEICNHRQATELHHCIVHDSKRYHRFVTVEENLMPICNICHTSLEQSANGYEIKVAFARRQMKRGYNIKDWYEALPMKVKENWVFEL